ncbi:RNAse III [Stanieria cyanosphaera PCC 7437]|uniref:Ribonuclease 3 n=1 Tax=Stanieria cyanosphaera (strain ATCC 29371 / PCC 7437) TaxID=111780 RepID=K9XVA3_STAC7|nr:ribonuclease III [Stanieria cyanosphaera]AFZ35999.1 RNAse III [Stanieria cyanosphaera PCC 7437]
MTLELPPIRDRNLFNHALTHRSYLNEHHEATQHNERLEFLGDAVLGFLVGELLYKKYPEMSEAQLTRLRSKLVDETQLGKLGQQLGLGKLMRLGRGAQKDKGRENPSLLNDTFEAIIGAYFLDAGIDAVRAYIQPIFIRLAEQIVTTQSKTTKSTFVDSKNQLQQWALAHQGENPVYQIIAEVGPPHAKEFTAQVSIKGVVYGQGKGHRKQEAQKQAAEAALKQLDA